MNIFAPVAIGYSVGVAIVGVAITGVTIEGIHIAGVDIARLICVLMLLHVLYCRSF